MITRKPLRKGLEMSNITSKLGRYCAIHGYYHEDEYLECDFCNEHNRSVYFHERYYNYGFSKCSYHACNKCHDTLFGPFGLVDVLIMERAYEDILEVINERTDKKGDDAAAITTATTIDYYEAARIAYTDREYMRKYIDQEVNVEGINKRFRPLWKFTYKIVSGEESKRVKVVNKDPDNLLVQWAPGGKTITEIFKEMNKGCRSVLYT
jgi:hypothetical protein